MFAPSVAPSSSRTTIRPGGWDDLLLSTEPPSMLSTTYVLKALAMLERPVP